jgi:single-strand DNA-binding protein
MSNFNKVILLGRLTRDPELRYTASGTAVAKIGLAVNNRYKQGEEWKEEPCFVNITVFGRQAETCNEYLSKGRQALFEGRLNYRKWETEDGQTKSLLEVVANNVQFLSSGRDANPSGSGGSPSGSGGSPAGQEPPPLDDGDVPF